ncbi:hypothetical protein KI387_037621, partial [Taxus chinensis]
MKLLSTMEGHRIVGSATNLYESLDKLPLVLMSGDKSELLNPKVVSRCSPSILEIDYGERLGHGDNFYVCANNHNNVFGDRTTTHSLSRQAGETCVCGNAMSCTVEFRQKGISETNSRGTAGEGSSGCGGGYVKETVTFIITDDLKVMPSSTIASITLLNRLNISDLSQLEERSAEVGPKQALALLFASLCSTTPLNDVFGVTVSTFAQEEGSDT